MESWHQLEVPRNILTCLFLIVIISVVSSLTLHDFYPYGEDSGDRSDFTTNGYAALELSEFTITNFKLVSSVSFNQFKVS